MKNILIILNAVLYNRGSEALVCGLTKVIKNSCTDCNVTLVSSEADFEKKADILNVDRYVCKHWYKRRKSLKYILVMILKKIFGMYDAAENMKYRKVIEEAKKSDMIFIIGADNYDKSYSMFPELHSLNKIIKRHSKAKLVLFDCSLEEEHIDNDIVSDIEMFDAVTVRESLTLDNFNRFIRKDRIHYFPDTAFVMEAETCVLPHKWKYGDMVGINLSNLVTEKVYGNDRNTILKSYEELIKYIIENTESSIVLIPHVMSGADMGVLRLLYNTFDYSGRVMLIEDENLKASQLKYIISKCRCFIGARTHATIAAYSSCIPTLAVGYSIKSKGIAKDLFGTYSNFVVPVKELNDRSLIDNFIWLRKNEADIRKHLTRIIPGYKAKVWRVAELIT